MSKETRKDDPRKAAAEEAAAKEAEAQPSLRDILNAFLQTAKEKHSDKAQKIVFKKQNDAMASRIQALNEAIQLHPKLKGFAFHEFQTADGQPIVDGDCPFMCCMPGRDPECDCCP